VYKFQLRHYLFRQKLKKFQIQNIIMHLFFLMDQHMKIHNSFYKVMHNFNLQIIYLKLMELI